MDIRTRFVDHVTSFSGCVKIPHSTSIRYKANDQGITTIVDTFDQDGTLMYSTEELIMSKEVFVLAYKTYIEGEKS